MRISNQIPTRVVMAMADASSYSMFGLRPRDVPDMGRLRGLVCPAQVETQLVECGDLLGDRIAEVSKRWPMAGAGPDRLEVLSTTFEAAGLSAARLGPDGIVVPIGQDDKSLGECSATLVSGGGFCVVGPPSSGKSNAVTLVASQAVGVGATVWSLTPRRSSLASTVGVGALGDDDLVEFAGRVAGVLDAGGWLVVVVDDAEMLAPAWGKALKELAESRRERCVIVAAGSPEEFRSFQSWTGPLKASRSGVLLGVTSATDGDVLKATLGFRGSVRLPRGRGFVLDDGQSHLCQLGVLPV
jgi:hypothetical protein